MNFSRVNRDSALGLRFWADATLAVTCAALLVLTAAWPTWIEGIFGVDPDAGSGLVEWAIVAILAATALASALHARSQWRRVYARS